MNTLKAKLIEYAILGAAGYIGYLVLQGKLSVIVDALKIKILDPTPHAYRFPVSGYEYDIDYGGPGSFGLPKYQNKF